MTAITRTLTTTKPPLITGRELTSLMRSHRVTLRELKHRSGFTLKQIRNRREIGFDSAPMIRDWVQAISGRDPGDVERWFAVSRRMQNVLRGMTRHVDS